MAAFYSIDYSTAGATALAGGIIVLESRPTTGGTSSVYYPELYYCEARIVDQESSPLYVPEYVLLLVYPAKIEPDQRPIFITVDKYFIFSSIEPRAPPLLESLPTGRP